MKRFLALVLCLLLLPVAALGIDYGKYNEPFNRIRDLIESYDFQVLLDELPGIQEKYPELFPDDLYERFEEKCKEGISLLEGVTVFYDPYDDDYYCWVADRKEPTEENSLVPVISDHGVTLYFMVPLKDWIKTEKYVALVVVNGEQERIEGYVKNREFDYGDSGKVETFYIVGSGLPLSIESLSFRFYGDTKNSDYEATEQQVQDIVQLQDIWETYRALYYMHGDDMYQVVKTEIK